MWFIVKLVLSLSHSSSHRRDGKGTKERRKLYGVGYLQRHGGLPREAPPIIKRANPRIMVMIDQAGRALVSSFSSYVHCTALARQESDGGAGLQNRAMRPMG